MWCSTYTTVLLLVSQLSGGVLGGSLVEVFRRSDNAERDMMAYAEAVVERSVEPRQSTATALKATAWNAEATAACISALTNLNGVASNPAGMAVCYNLPFLDNTTGTFEADLRLYMIGQPTGDFTGVPSQNVTVGLQYANASAETIDPNELMRRNLEFSLLSRPIKARDGAVKRQAMVPVMIQMYALKGQIDQNLLTSTMTK
jgi:hypothetical protein